MRSLAELPTQLRSFADVPAEVRRRVAAGERVLVVLLDGLGLEFLHRHAGHPLLGRLELRPLRAQFPSTTTAHLTTMHYGIPVQQHGLYEFYILEPALGEIICPLRFSRAAARVDGQLEAELDPALIVGAPTFYQSLERELGARSAVLQPRRLERTGYTRLVSRGARVIGFTSLEQGVRRAVDVLGSGECRYAFLYWDQIDSAGHMHGPESAEYARAARDALDAVWRALTRRRRGAARELTVLLTADHGMVSVAPDRVEFVDLLWPELLGLLEHAWPAGSSRDLFLHVGAERAGVVIEELSARLGERARVVPARELFAQAGPALEARLADVAVLPAPGRQAWLRSAPAAEQWVRGHHGGLTEAETATYLARVLWD